MDDVKQRIKQEIENLIASLERMADELDKKGIKWWSQLSEDQKAQIDQRTTLMFQKIKELRDRVYKTEG